MEDAKLTGLLVSFFYEGSEFYKALQAKERIPSIQSFKTFISNLQKNQIARKTQVKEISKCVFSAIELRPQIVTAQKRQNEFAAVIEIIFSHILNLPFFLTWGTKNGSYFINVPVPLTQPKEFLRVSKLLDELMTENPPKNYPSPALVVQILRQGKTKLFPCLEIQVQANLNGQGIARKKYILQSVVCLNHANRLETYTRQQDASLEMKWAHVRQNDWNHFKTNPLKKLEGQLKFINNLRSLQDIEGMKEKAQLEELTKHCVVMMETCAYLIYVPHQSQEEVPVSPSRNQLNRHNSDHVSTLKGTMENSSTPAFPSITFPPRSDWKGIHGDKNSCFMDSLMMALLSCTKCEAALYSVFTTSQRSLRHAERLSEVNYVWNIIETIAAQLKTYGYCGKSPMWDLRNTLSRHNPSLLGEMLDVTEFVNILFSCCLGAPYFVTYKPSNSLANATMSKEIGSYFHQIIIGPVGNMEATDVSSLLKRSMEFQGIRFKSHPQPFLIIKLPLNNGKLVGVQSVLPNLVLTIDDTIQEDEIVFEYELTGIICLQHMHYTTFVRLNEYDWIHFDSMSSSLMGPQVQYLADFTSSLASGANSRCRILELQKILISSCLCIYMKQSQIRKYHQMETHPMPEEEQTQNIAASDSLICEILPVETEQNKTNFCLGQGSYQTESEVSSYNINVERARVEETRIARANQMTSLHTLELIDSLLCLLQSCHTSLSPILQGLVDKLKISCGIALYELSEESQSSCILQCIDWSTEIPTYFFPQFYTVWSKLTQLAFGKDPTSFHFRCIRMCGDEAPYVTIQEFYDQYQFTKLTSTMGLAFSLQRYFMGPKPIKINTQIVIKGFNATQTLQLVAVVCFTAEQGIVTYFFHGQSNYWSKRQSNGNKKIHILKTVDNTRNFLKFTQEEQTELQPDTQIIQQHSIGAIYARLHQPQSDM